MATLHEMLDAMVLDVTTELRISIDEVRSWTWRRLLKAHERIARREYERYVESVQVAEAAHIRAEARLHGVKDVKDYPAFEQTYRSPWEPVEEKPVKRTLLDKIKETAERQQREAAERRREDLTE